ncbi:MAG: formate/nitrite transporter family protein [Gammaproteobacteria bacterium]|nr:MAG: formate/nitrite transporter family protein [Gammaproteobacteria bacterium]
MDSVTPTELVRDGTAAGLKKAQLPVRDMLLRGALSGAILGIATSLAFVIVSQGLPPIAGAIAFPVGFVILVLLGLELVTGNFALFPQAVAARKLGAGQMLSAWCWVYAGNLLGSVAYAVLFWAAYTYFGTSDGGALAEITRAVAEKKTLAYAEHGAAGWATALTKAVLCNWMVTIGTVLAFASRSTIGRIAAMWLPITIFFAHGYEHCVVNMFVIPAGMLFGAGISAGDWWLWNQIPATLGNIAGGAVLTGLALWYTHARPQPTGNVLLLGTPGPGHDEVGERG